MNFRITKLLLLASVLVVATIGVATLPIASAQEGQVGKSCQLVERNGQFESFQCQGTEENCEAFVEAEGEGKCVTHDKAATECEKFIKHRDGKDADTSGCR